MVSLDRRTSRILRERDSINSRFSNPLSLGKPEAKQAAVDHFKVHQRTIVSGQPDLNLPSSPILHSEHDFTFDIDFDNHSDSFVINSQAFHLISGLVNPPGNVLPVTSSGCQERNASIVKVEQWVDGSELGSISESSMSRW